MPHVASIQTLNLLLGLQQPHTTFARYHPLQWMPSLLSSQPFPPPSPLRPTLLETKRPIVAAIVLPTLALLPKVSSSFSSNSIASATYILGEVHLQTLMLSLLSAAVVLIAFQPIKPSISRATEREWGYHGRRSLEARGELRRMHISSCTSFLQNT